MEFIIFLSYISIAFSRWYLRLPLLCNHAQLLQPQFRPRGRSLRPQRTPGWSRPRLPDLPTPDGLRGAPEKHPGEGSGCRELQPPHFRGSSHEVHGESWWGSRVKIMGGGGVGSIPGCISNVPTKYIANNFKSHKKCHRTDLSQVLLYI